MTVSDMTPDQMAQNVNTPSTESRGLPQNNFHAVFTPHFILIPHFSIYISFITLPYISFFIWGIL
jgi:hypothetical protein